MFYTAWATSLLIILLTLAHCFFFLFFFKEFQFVFFWFSSLSIFSPSVCHLFPFLSQFPPCSLKYLALSPTRLQQNTGSFVPIHSPPTPALPPPHLPPPAPPLPHRSVRTSLTWRTHLRKRLSSFHSSPPPWLRPSLPCSQGALCLLEMCVRSLSLPLQAVSLTPKTPPGPLLKSITQIALHSSQSYLLTSLYIPLPPPSLMLTAS